ncbi:MAG: aspartyl-tRNA(Asn)/glutamyl-tRNA(Gln) amidotransferase subunit [Hyphomicrobiales bacterium]|nr:aspartyl-tRNA(Asn)/glutamyl-tRNA(Gln) amidotransferase subunit [Hyphomicrobiales bacterium]
MTVRDRLEAALSRIADPAGEGGRTCLTVYPEAAHAAADAADARAKAGISLGPLDGTIVSIKDLFDVKGEPTRAGSKILANASPATADAPVVRRLRAAGAVIVAKTAMSEFAFSGVGMNPHYGTPGNPADRARVPGGSSSGAAVAAADGMCEIAIGSDTGGSTRIPAALCGVVGYKPTKSRISTEGAFPLSYTLDSIGPVARSVAECAMADAVMAGEEFAPLEAAPLSGLRFGIPQGLPLKDLDATVIAAFSDAVARLGKAGVRVTDEPMPLIDGMLAVNAKGGFAPTEAFAVHRENLKTRAADFDPNVRFRIERGGKASAADYVDMMRDRARLVRAMDAQMSRLDVLVLPTTPIVAPTIAEMQDADTFGTKNMLLLRNTLIWNFFDNCAISIPLPRNGLPVGLMLVARNGDDRRLFEIATAVERLFA